MWKPVKSQHLTRSDYFNSGFEYFHLLCLRRFLKFSPFLLPCEGHGGKVINSEMQRISFIHRTLRLKAFKKVISYHKRPSKVKGTVNTRSPTTPLLLFHPGATRLKSFGLTAFHIIPTCRNSPCSQEISFCHGEARIAYPERILPPTSRDSFLVLVLCSCRAKWLSAFFQVFHRFSDN